MKKWFKHIDDYLVRNRPVFWFTRCHYLYSLLVVYALLSYLVSDRISVSGDYFTLLLLSCIGISILILIAYIRLQVIFFNPRFSAQQLGRIFLLNIIGVFSLGIVTLIGPYHFTQRALAISAKMVDVEDEYKLKVALIPDNALQEARLMEIADLKMHLPSVETAAIVQDTVRTTLQQETPMPAESRNNIIDSIVMLSQYRLFEDGSAQYISYATTADIDTNFFRYVQKLTPPEIVSIKRNTNALLDKYAFKHFNQEYYSDDLPDSTFAAAANRFSKLYAQKQKIVNNGSFFQDPSNWALVMGIVLLICTHLITIVILNIRPLNKIIAIGFNILAAILFAIFSIGGNSRTLDYFHVFCLGGFIIFTLAYIFRFTRQKYWHTRFKLLYLSSTYLMIQVAIGFMLMSFEPLFSQHFAKYDPEPTVEAYGTTYHHQHYEYYVYCAIFFFFTLLFNRFFMKRFYLLNNIPK